MAVINNGPLTNGIRGKVGDLIFQMVNGIQVVRAMPASIQDPNTPLQQIQRAAFTQAVIEWRDLDVEERELWNFYARLRGNKQTHRAARRVDCGPKPTNGTLWDGHNGVVGQKSREADYNRMHGDVLPDPIDLQDPPPFAKTKNLPPAHVQVILVMGSKTGAFGGTPGVNYDGLWWFCNEVIPRVGPSRGRAWVQPPYPIHSQRITIEDEGVPDVWGESEGILAHDFHLWAWKLQSQDQTVRIVVPDDDEGPWEVTTPYVWKSQLDFLDGAWQDTKGSAVIKFYLPLTMEFGIYQVWPTFEWLLPGP